MTVIGEFGGEPGTKCEIRNSTKRAFDVEIGSGAYGTLRVTLPPGRYVTLTLGTIPPTVNIYDPDTDIGEADNVIPIHKDD